MNTKTIAALIIVFALTVSIGISSASANFSTDALSAIVTPLERIIQAIQTLLMGESGVAQTATTNQSNIPAGHKGYYPRACGFDMDDDGIIGEPGDDCNVCDGVTTDVDGDGLAEDLIYVDCQDGNNANPGTPNSPKRTIAAALSTADGPGDGREDIICVRAACSGGNGSAVNAQSLGTSGVAGTKTKSPTGNEVYSFKYPTNPFMIVGWDTDNDGQYPPYDIDQPKPFVIDACNTPGCTTANIAAALNIDGGTDNVELAHFSIKNYGRQLTNTSVPHYAIRFSGGGSDRSQYIHIHDIVLDSINRNIAAHDAFRGLDFRNGPLDFASFENLKFVNTSSWPARGGNSVSLNGSKWRFKNISYADPVSVSTGSSGQVQPFKLWRTDGIEFLDSYFDGSSVSTSAQMQGIYYNKGTSNSHIIGNLFRDFSNPIVVSYKDDDSNGNVGRNVDNIFIRRNYATWSDGRTCGTGCRSAQMVRITSAFTDGQERDGDGTNMACTGGAGGNSDCTCSANIAPTYLGNIEVSDNVVDFNDNRNIYGFISYQNGSNCGSLPADAGPLRVHNNTVLNYNPNSSGDNYAAFVFGHSSAFDWDFKYVDGQIFFYNNIVSGASGKRMVTNEKAGADGCGPGTATCNSPGYYDATDFFANNNIYETNGTFARANTAGMSLSAWRTATGEESLSTNSCSPQFGANGYSLLTSDVCARDKGNAANCSARDIGGVSRPQGSACDIGADEVGGTIEEPVSYACSDGRDNDVPADGLIDYPADPGCTSATDNDEYNVPVTSTTTCDTTYPANSFRVCYFDGISAPTTAVTTLSTAIETTVPSPVGTWAGFSKSWGTGVVTPTAKSDSVSAVWRGRINFSAGTYTFQTQSDDGVELIIQNVNGGTPIITNWTTHANTTNTSQPITLSGTYNVQLRYFENSGSANIGLSWTKTTTQPPAACADGIDNDGDALVDLADPGCTSATDNDEYNVPAAACSDNIDNDGDGLKDMADPGCASTTDNDEFNLPPASTVACAPSSQSRTTGQPASFTASGGNGTFSWSASGGSPASGTGATFSTTYTSTGTKTVTVISNSVLASCSVTVSAPPIVSQCSDGLDNDSDSKTDYPADPGCTTATDNDEYNAPPQSGVVCSDGIDNDSDGLTDMSDHGCGIASDTDESNPTPVSRFSRGSRVVVLGLAVNIRSYPGDSSATPPQQQQGAEGTVVSGPKWAFLDGNGYWYWNVNFDEGADGWATNNPLSPGAVAPSIACANGTDDDGDGRTDMQDPGCINADDTSESNPSVSTKFTEGANITVSGTNGANVREYPAGPTVGAGQAYQATGRVVAGPKYALFNGTGVWWWQIDYTSGNDGWSGENILTLTTAPPTYACSNGTDDDGDGKVDFGTGPNNDPGCTSATDNDEFNLPPTSAVTCTPSTQSAYTGNAVSFTVSGGSGSFTWAATGGSPSTGSGATFSTTYSSTGEKTVIVTSGSAQDSCSVSVTTTPPIQPTNTTQGYQSRACGLDLDFDGVRGEPEDCNEICRAPVDSSGNVTVSVETYREEIYVDTVNGVDGASCGLNGKKPCKTIARAWNEIDAVGSSAKADVVCFAGTDRSLSHFAPKSHGLATVNGAAATYTVTQSGNEVRDFIYPKYPTMLVGWDKDRDGKYPPHDSDDLAILDGTGKPTAFDFTENKNQYIELAHFKAVKYGDGYDVEDRNDWGPTYVKGFAEMNNNGISATTYKCAYRSLHDIELEDINKGEMMHDSRRVFSFMGSCPIQYTAIENILCKNCGGWYMRGGWGKSVEGVTKGPLRVKNNSLHVLSNPLGAWNADMTKRTAGGSVGIKFWVAENVEIIDNIFNSGVQPSDISSETWPADSDGAAGIYVSSVGRNWDVVNNKLINYSRPFIITQSSMYTNHLATTDKINFSRNVAITSFAEFTDQFTCIKNVVGEDDDVPGNDGGQVGYTNDVTFHSNVCVSEKMIACIYDNTGNTNLDLPKDPGTNRYVNNTCRAPGGIGFGGFVVLGHNYGDATPVNYQRRYVIKNNIFSTNVAANTFRVAAGLLSSIDLFDVNNNVYSSGAKFYWGDNASTDLAGWRNTPKGPDANSKTCAPTFQSPLSGNFHLQSTDTCARNSGVAYTNFTPMYDMDGQLYGTDGRWDIGADEYR